MGVKIQVIGPSFRLLDNHLSDQARKRLLNADLMEFGRMFGDRFISGVTIGGLFFAFLEFQASSMSELETLSASLNAQVGTFKASAQMNSRVESLSKKYNYTLRILKITNTADTVPVPADPKEDQGQPGGQDQAAKDPLIEAVINFPKEVSKTRAAVTGYETKSFEESTNLPMGQKVPDFFAFRQLLIRLATEADKTKTMLGDIAFIRKHPQDLPKFPRKFFRVLRRETVDLPIGY